MKRFSPLFFVAIAAFLMSLAACNRPVDRSVYIPDIKPLVAGVTFTEATTLGAVQDVRLQLDVISKASVGLPSEVAVKAAVAQVEAANKQVEAAVAAHPASEVKAALDQLLQAIEVLKKQIVELKKENAALKSKNVATWHWILNGGGVFFTLLAVASGFFSASIPVVGPYLGPRIGVLCGALAGTLFVLGYLYDWTQAHPVWTAATVVALLAGSAGLAWGNAVKHHEKPVVAGGVK